MSYILNIDTSTESAFVCLSQNEMPLETICNANQKEHAIFLHKAIQQLCSNKNVSLKDITAVAVTEGPGSYTGLRVGMSTAKGLCYALQKPLITISSLLVSANACKMKVDDPNAYYCPMIDARRMEVFTALYNYKMDEIAKPNPMILNEHSFVETLLQNRIYFCGNGNEKFSKIIENANAFFLDLDEKMHSLSMSQLSFNSIISKDFKDLVLSNPTYLKEYVAS